jgi:hypothetical protein
MPGRYSRATSTALVHQPVPEGLEGIDPKSIPLDRDGCMLMAAAEVFHFTQAHAAALEEKRAAQADMNNADSPGEYAEARVRRDDATDRETDLQQKKASAETAYLAARREARPS